MRFSRIISLLLAGFLAFGSLNTVAATKQSKTVAVAKKTVKTKAKKASETVKFSQKSAKKAEKTKKTAVKAVSKKHKVAKNVKATKLKSKQAVKKVSKNAKVKAEKKAKLTRRHFQSGVASYYADMFNGRRTASGERFHNSAMTAAHRSLPFGTMVEVTNLRNGRKAIVRINDRGPYAHSRVIDLSKKAARQIGMAHTGTARVKLAIVNKTKH